MCSSACACPGSARRDMPQATRLLLDTVWNPRSKEAVATSAVAFSRVFVHLPAPGHSGIPASSVRRPGRLACVMRRAGPSGKREWRPIRQYANIDMRPKAGVPTYGCERYSTMVAKRAAVWLYVFERRAASLWPTGQTRERFGPDLAHFRKCATMAITKGELGGWPG